MLELMDHFVAATSSLWQKFFVYAQSAEFRQGLFIQFAGGILFELVLFVFSVQTALWLMNRPKRQQSAFLTSFFGAQFCRESFLLLLRIGGVKDESAEIDAALSNGKLDSWFSHVYYGNTENLRDLLQLRLGTNAHLAGYISLDAEAITELSAEAERMISKIDQSILLCAAFGQNERSMKLYGLRVAFFGLRDELRHESRQPCSSGRSGIQLLTSRLGALLSSLFGYDKRTLDANLRHALRKH